MNKQNLTITEERRRTMGIRQFYDELPDHIIPVQKAIPPYMPFTEGYGFLGVMLLDTEKDRVQCHFCGYWFKALSAHMRKHKMSTNQYKDKVGLYRKEALMSLRTKLKFSETHNKEISGKNILKTSGNFRDRKYREKSQEEFANGATKIQWKNRYGTCDAQLKFRLEELIKKYGMVPTSEQAGTLHSTFGRRFGSWSKGLVFYGYEPARTPGGYTKGIPKDKVLDDLVAPQCRVYSKIIERETKNDGTLQDRIKWLNKKTCSVSCLEVYLANKYPVQSCKVKDCTNKYSAKGYCNAHYLAYIKPTRVHYKRVFNKELQNV